MAKDRTVPLIKAHGIARGYNEIGFDAVAVSANDLMAGEEFFTKPSNESVPWISANVLSSGNQLLFPPHILKKVGSLTIGIIGLTGGKGKSVNNLRVEAPHSALEAEINKLGDRYDILVVLSSLTKAENDELVKDFDQIDIIITSYQKRGNIQPQVSGNCLITQSAGRGQYLGQLQIDWVPKGNWRTAPSQSSDQLKKKLASVEIQIQRIKQQQTEIQTDLSRKIARMQSYRNSLAEQLNTHKEQNIAAQDMTAFNTFKSTFLPIKPTKSPQNIEVIVRDIKSNINGYNQQRRLSSRQNDLTVQKLLQTESIVGSESCRKCHEKQYSFWYKTHHAKAYATLADGGQSYNLECLPCHVTAGKVRPSSPETERVLLLSLPSDRQPIGCEVCHGPGMQHTKSPEDIKPQKNPAKELCTQCHTPERDDQFDYTAKLMTIACPGN